MKKTLIYAKQIGRRNATINVSKRNAEILAKELNADILMRSNDRIKSKDYDVIILTYLNRYTDYVTLRELLKENQTRVLIRTEYEQISAGFIKPYINICNFEGGENFLNLNLLIARNANKKINKKYDCVYYGRYRKDRMLYCREYLQDNIYLSTHSKNHKHYYHAGCRPRLIKELNWIKGGETLNLFRYSLYIEDVYTHSVFNNLANRWYEAGICNNVVFFDINCINTINKSGLRDYKDQVKNYIVSNYNELAERIECCNDDFYKHLDIQKGWRVNELKERGEMIDKIKSIIYS